MRIVLLGASPVGVAAAKLFLERGDEVVIIEQNQEKIDALEEGLDCGFVCGDGSRPAVLKEVSPENTDVLFCVSDSDQDNIIASLIGRSMAFGRVVTKITDPDFEEICDELGLADAIVPDRQVAQALLDLSRGSQNVSMTARIGGDVRFFSFKISGKHAGGRDSLGLPDDTLPIAVTRDGKTRLLGKDDELKEGDELLVATHDKRVEELCEKFLDDSET